mmetsp:Transcript_96068/g.266916  ORF Transcript_96068/g.266916 Transcript_96068/m.266916 type:complete len:326 (-) Transcript_96068:69-1046(-)
MPLARLLWCTPSLWRAVWGTSSSAQRPQPSTAGAWHWTAGLVGARVSQLLSPRLPTLLSWQRGLFSHKCFRCTHRFVLLQSLLGGQSPCTALKMAPATPMVATSPQRALTKQWTFGWRRGWQRNSARAARSRGMRACRRVSCTDLIETHRGRCSWPRRTGGITPRSCSLPRGESGKTTYVFAAASTRPRPGSWRRPCGYWRHPALAEPRAASWTLPEAGALARRSSRALPSSAQRAGQLVSCRCACTPEGSTRSGPTSATRAIPSWATATTAAGHPHGARACSCTPAGWLWTPEADRLTCRFRCPVTCSKYLRCWYEWTAVRPGS